MKQLLKVVIIILSVAYPFMVYWGLQHYQAAKLLPLILIILGLRWLTGTRSTDRLVLLATLIAVVSIALIWGYQLGLKFYPVMVNLGFLVLFASSLVSPPSIVEKMARIRDPELSPEAVVYTLNVTRLWTVFFLLNGCIAAGTALWASDEIWTLYNGFIAYLLIGLLAGGEWIVRRRVVRQ